MIPDRTNYEIWLIDYLDGKLDPGQVKQLTSFLNNNPDIQEEFKEITQYCLNPGDNTFRYKNNLKKSVSDISESEFEYLCVAALENDLSDSQVTELNDILAENPEKRETHKLIQTLKLSAPVAGYMNKSKLIKLTAGQKIIRFSVAALSVAATIAIMISIFSISDKKNTSVALENSNLTNAVVANTAKIATNIAPVEEKKTINFPLNNNLSLKKTLSEKMESSNTGKPMTDSSVNNSVIRPVIISKVDFRQKVNIVEKSFEGTLVAINTPPVSIPGTDEKPGYNRFIAKIFREKILKSNDPQQGQLKPFEIADAGIIGLNKLFGWQMSLKKNKDEKGEVKSFYFNSKLLKFNVPVKKVASLP
jgi:hypothetical protein